MKAWQGQNREKLKDKTSIYKQNHFVLRKSGVLFSIVSEAPMRVKEETEDQSPCSILRSHDHESTQIVTNPESMNCLMFPIHEIYKGGFL